MTTRRLALLSLLLLVLPVMRAAEPAAVVHLAWWNVENLFDDIDDPGDHDNSVMRYWTTEMYQRKVADLAQEVRAMNGGRGPDILGVAEVESARAMQALAKAIGGEPAYHVVHQDGHDHRGIEVALLSRYPVTSSESIMVFEGTRDLMHVQLDIQGAPLHVLLLHWKSRYGGAERTEPDRIECAKVTRKVVAGILAADRHADIVVMGDFNDTPVNVSVATTLGAGSLADAESGKALLVNVVTEVQPPVFPGSYNYKGSWDYIDQMLVSPALFDDRGVSYVPKSFAVFTDDGKLLRDGKPFRFQSRKKPYAGYSDHLPLTLDLTLAGHPDHAPN